MRVLDLFCGYGGWSDGFFADDWEILGIDNERSVRSWYPYDLLLQDILTLDPGRLTGQFDVIVASPPCTEFSTAIWPKRLEQPNMDCVNMVKTIVARAKPKYWVMENVRGAIKYLGTPKLRYFPWYFWGNFPQFLKYAERAPNKGTKKGGVRWFRDPRRVAMIPLEISVPLAKSCRSAIENSS